MTIVNKITCIGPNTGTPMTTAAIQDHIDSMNADGYYLIAVDNLVGGYRFFWAKEIA